MVKNEILSLVKNRVFENSLQTCEYIDGYDNANSIITVRCIKHNYIFQTKYENLRRDNRKHHICPLCQKEDQMESKQKVICAYCGKEIFRAPSKIKMSKSGLFFCCREHKDLAQRLDSGDQFITIRPSHYGETQKNYRQIALREYPHKCAICGWDEDVDMLEVHHINEDHNDNDLNNLIILCPLCHKKLTTHKYKLINRTKIIRL